MIYDYEVTTGNGETLKLADFKHTADMKKVEECIKALL